MKSPHVSKVNCILILLILFTFPLLFQWLYKITLLHFHTSNLAYTAINKNSPISFVQGMLVFRIQLK